MTELLADRPRVSDLRGSAAAPIAGTAILEDPTGGRRRRLRRIGRALAVVLTLWLLALVLGAVGLNPVPGIPFARVLRPAAAPPVRHLPPPVAATPSDLQPALPAGAPVRATARPSEIAPIPISRRTAGGSPTQRAAAKTKSRSVAVHTLSPATPATPAAGHAVTTHANNGKAVGHTQAPTTTTTTTPTTTSSPGKSQAAPGHSATPPAHGKSGTTTSTTP